MRSAAGREAFSVVDYRQLPGYKTSHAGQTDSGTPPRGLETLRVQTSVVVQAMRTLIDNPEESRKLKVAAAVNRFAKAVGVFKETLDEVRESVSHRGRSKPIPLDDRLLSPHQRDTLWQLKRYRDVHTYAQLAKLCPADVLCTPGIGIRGLNFVRTLLAEDGRSLRNDTPDKHIADYPHLTVQYGRECLRQKKPIYLSDGHFASLALLVKLDRLDPGFRCSSSSLWHQRSQGPLPVPLTESVNGALRRALELGVCEAQGLRLAVDSEPSTSQTALTPLGRELWKAGLIRTATARSAKGAEIVKFG